MVRYVVRPPTILTTPRMLADRLGARLRSSRYYHSGDPSQDFYLGYSDPNEYNEDPPESFYAVADFFSCNKFEQMKRIRDSDIKTPLHYLSDRMVVRPYRHSQGTDFTVVPQERCTVNSSQYAVPFFNKQYEYRMLYCLGSLMAVLAKVVPEGTSNELPWNHAQGSSFQQVEWDRCRLRFTDVRTKLEEFDVIQNGHLIGVDVMLRRPEGRTTGWEYAVCEFNSAPSLTIEPVIERIVNHVNERY